MAAKCPNRKRKKRLANGRGKCGCEGTLQLKLLVPIMLPANRWPRTTDPQAVFDRALYGTVRKSGYRLNPRELFAAIAVGRWNLQCPSCGWTLKTPTKERGC